MRDPVSKSRMRTGETAQWFRVLSALAEDLDLIPSIYILALTSMGTRRAHGICTYRQTKHSYT